MILGNIHVTARVLMEKEYWGRLLQCIACEHVQVAGPSDYTEHCHACSRKLYYWTPSGVRTNRSLLGKQPDDLTRELEEGVFGRRLFVSQAGDIGAVYRY